jgi:DNA-binding NtrC family response regulator
VIDFQKVQERLGIVGTSEHIQQAVHQLVQAAPTDLSVLLTGESGTGKEVFAKAVHTLSRRAQQRLVSVNCGAIPETLLESELFGHEKGAFTGANEQRKGFFETADNGTIFLDEIGEMPFNTQVKLLRVLESGEFSRLCSSDTLKVNVRVIAATNRDPELEIRNGMFRQDLYFRLKSVHIRLPALREHPEDIPALVHYFAQRVSEKSRFSIEGFSDDAMRLLMNLPWQGNVRELKNFIEAVITLNRGKFVDAEMLRPHVPQALNPPVIFDQTSNNVSLVPIEEPRLNIPPEALYSMLVDLRNDVSSIKQVLQQLTSILIKPKELPAFVSSQTETPFMKPVDSSDILEQQPTLEEMERELIERTLQRFEGSRRKTASALGISERTLYRKINQFGIEE